MSAAIRCVNYDDFKLLVAELALRDIVFSRSGGVAGRAIASDGGFDVKFEPNAANTEFPASFETDFTKAVQVVDTSTLSTNGVF